MACNLACMRVKWYAIVAAVALSAPAAAQISMGRPGLTGVPQGRKMTAPAKPQPQEALTADEQQRVAALIKRMSPKQRRKFNRAVKRMTPQQRKQLIANIKQQFAQERIKPLR
jgi:CelD/BcsL family acetyltransferase involved in cellulose biosynthesis